MKFFCVFCENYGLSVSLYCVKGLVVFNPFFHIKSSEMFLCVADNHAGDACVDNHTLAHGTGTGVFNISTCDCIFAYKVECGAYHTLAGSVDNGVLLCVHTAAKLVSFTAGYVVCFSYAVTEINAVFSASGSTHITCGNNLVVVYDDCAVVASQTGATLKYGFCNIQIIVFLIYTIHKRPPLKNFLRIINPLI